MANEIWFMLGLRPMLPWLNYGVGFNVSDFGVTDFRTVGYMDYVIKLDVRMGIQHL